MIDEKYIELMNYEIDRVITADQKIKLHNYLSESKEAREYYDELKSASGSLNQLQDKEPSENLKKLIMNSIDFSLYAPVHKQSRIAWLGTAFRLRYISIFAAGLLASVFIYSLFTINPAPVNEDDITGTIGISAESKTIEEIPLNYQGIQGSIVIAKQGEKFWFNISSNSAQPIDFIIDYPDKVQLENIKPEMQGDLKISRSNNSIKTTNSGSQQYSIVFTTGNIASSPLGLKVIQSGKTLYEREITLKR